MFGLFRSGKGSRKKAVIKSPVIGKCFDIGEIPDEAFAMKMMGDGFGVQSSDGVLYAPADGEVLQLFPTRHALLLKTKEGLEILLHIGLETVAMDGEGFKAHIENGDKVKAGDKLISFDIDLIRQKSKTDLSPIVITNMDMVEDMDLYYGNTDKNTVVANIILK